MSSIGMMRFSEVSEDLSNLPGEATRELDGGWHVYTSPLGAKPLYIYRDGSAVLLSDSVGLLAENVNLSLNWDSLRQASLPGNSPAGHASFVDHVRVIPAGSQGHVARDDEDMSDYEWVPSTPLDAGALITELESSLQEMLDDTPLTLLMSGGTDSSLLAVILTRMSIDFTGIVLRDIGSYDVSAAQKLASELGVDLQVLEISWDEFLQLMAKAVYVFEDARPDIFCAVGLLKIAEHAAAGSRLVGGEPADAILGGLRDYSSTSSDDERNSLRYAFLKDQAPRDVFLLRRAAEVHGLATASPYAFGPLVRRALGTPWERLLDASSMVRPDRYLGGPGYKLLQREAAQLLQSSALLDIAYSPKRGLPSSVGNHWGALRSAVGPRTDDAIDPLWQLSGELFEEIVLGGELPEKFDVERFLR